MSSSRLSLRVVGVQKRKSQLQPEDQVFIILMGTVTALAIVVPWAVVLLVSHSIWEVF